jgi:hypothetical protein
MTQLLTNYRLYTQFNVYDLCTVLVVRRGRRRGGQSLAVAEVASRWVPRQPDYLSFSGPGQADPVDHSGERPAAHA